MSTPYLLKNFSTLPENFPCSHPENLSKPLNNSQPPGIFHNPLENFTHTLKISQPPPPSPKKISTLPKKSQPLPKKTQPLPKKSQPLTKKLQPLSKKLSTPPEKMSTRPPE